MFRPIFGTFFGASVLWFVANRLTPEFDFNYHPSGQTPDCCHSTGCPSKLRVFRQCFCCSVGRSKQGIQFSLMHLNSTLTISWIISWKIYKFDKIIKEKGLNFVYKHSNLYNSAIISSIVVYRHYTEIFRLNSDSQPVLQNSLFFINFISTENLWIFKF